MIILISFGCKDAKPKEKPLTAEQMLAKSWKLNKFNMQGQLTGPEIMANSSFTFYKNGRYEILMGALDRGNWSLSADKKILITQKDGAPSPGEMDILTLTPTKLVLTNTGNDSPMTMELTPIQ